MKQLTKGLAIASSMTLMSGISNAQWLQTGVAAHIDPGAGVSHVNIGTGAPFGNATLRVRGDQLAVNSGVNTGLCTFRTDVASGVEQGWEMWRDVNKIGRIWHYGLNGPAPGGHRALHIQSMEQRDDGQDRYSGVFLMNNDNDGFWLSHNGPPTGGRAFPDPALQLLDCKGYAALGYRPGYINTGNTRPRGPWSRFHLFHDVTGTRPWFAFRSQMLNGITLTGNSDLAYMGQWFDHGPEGTSDEVDDNSNLVVATSEDALPAGLAHSWDNISFRFFSDLASAEGSSSTVEGLEMMRIQPQRPVEGARIEGMVGVGDFLAAAAVPEERLDVLDRTIRARAIPTSYNDDNLDKVLVIDDDGRFWWRDASTLGGGGGLDCDWDPATGNIAAAWETPGTNLLCPEADNTVGIGTSNAAGKLHVQADFHNSAVLVDQFTAGANNGIGVRVTGTSGTSYGQTISLTGASSYNVGLQSYVTTTNSGGWSTAGAGTFNSYSTGAMYTWGLDAQANGTGSQSTGSIGRSLGLASSNVGVAGHSQASTFVFAPIGGASRTGVYGHASDPVGATVCYGVYGEAVGPDDPGGPNGHTKWAGYFPGNAYVGGTVFSSSDAQLKENIEVLEGAVAMEKLMALEPKTYDFNQDAFPFMHLPSEHQFGLIAQEVESVIPEMVANIHQPASIDSVGNEVDPAIDFKALNYQALIPILVAGFKEQQAQIASLQEQLASCCALIGGGLLPPNNDGRSAMVGSLDLREERLLISPNPFTHQTTISYYMPHNGRVRLEVSDAHGRALKTLREEETSEGVHSYTWNTESLAPGTYFVALVVDENVVVKRAVKVSER